MMGNMGRYLDAAVLKPELDRAGAAEAIRHCIGMGAFSVCVRPCDIELALALCSGTETAVGVVLGFPHGTATTQTKAFEAECYAGKGVAEIDMVANYGLIKSGEWALVERDIAAVAGVAGKSGILLKVILETCYLSMEEIARATEAAIAAGADFVKTSTGFAAGGATPEAVRAMVAAAGGRIRVKASGGIRDAATASMYLSLGAQRLGVNYGSLRAILEGAPADGSGGY